MDSFTLVDIIVAVIILVSGGLAYARGCLREVLAILGWVVAAVVAFWYTPDVMPLAQEIPVDAVKNLFESNASLAMLATFFIIFALTLIVFSIFAPVIAGAVQRSALGALDQGLGFLFGIARGVLLVLIAFMLYDFIRGEREGVESVEASFSRELLQDIQTNVETAVPVETLREWFTAKYEDLQARTLSTEES